jgi:hypothetical protein
MTEDDVKARFEKENIEIFFMTLFRYCQLIQEG